MEAKETIVVKAYDLLKYLLPVLSKMPRDQRFLLGDRLQTMASDILELLIEAVYMPTSQKKARLNKVNILLEKMRHFVRLGFELGYYNSKRYHFISEKLNEIGRMTGGWIKSLP
jgi:hypothetical protein